MRVVAGASCELCAQGIPQHHRHLTDLDSHTLLCACRGCATLFDRHEVGGRRLRLVPERVMLRSDFEIDDAAWAALGIQTEMAFFFRSERRLVAFYPSPLGMTRASLTLDAECERTTFGPLLHDLEPDVEALLVNRSRDRHQHWLVPVDRCYELVGLIRTHWRGLAGGAEVWSRIEAFFSRLEERMATGVA